MGELGSELLELRRELNARPLFLAALALALALSSAFVGWHLLFCLPILAVASSWRNAALITAAVGIGFFLRVDADPPRVEGELDVAGTFRVISVPVRRGEEEVVEIRSRDLTLQMPLTPDFQVSLGDLIRTEGTARPLTRPEYRVNGVGGIFTPTELEIVRSGWPIWKSAADARRSFDRFVDQHAPPASAALLNALCFSMTAELSEETNDALVRSGTRHIAATSGMHVLIAGWAMLLALSRIPIPRWLQLLLVAAALILYAGAAGLRPSIIRAVIMMIVWAAAPFVGRERDGLSALSAGAIFYLLWRPDGVVDVGFLLSVSAVAGLVMFAPRFQSMPEGAWPRIWHGIKGLAAASLIVQIAVLPITALVFGQFSVASLAANLLVVPVLGAVIISAFAAWICGAGWLLAWTTVPLTGWLLGVIHFFGLQPWSAVQVPSFSGYWLVPLYLAGLIAWRPHVRPA